MNTMDALNSDTAQFVSDLTTTALLPKVISKSTFLTVPSTYKLQDVTAEVEKALPEPLRKRGTVVLGDVPSLLAYLKDQAAQATGYVYADIDSRTVTAVFNDAKDGPGWRDHCAKFTAELTPEAKRWLEHDGKSFGQTEFAEFIEDNFADLQGDDASALLTVATTIQAASGINFSSARRLQDGQTQLVYNEVIDATAGQNGEFKIPKTFKLGLRLFKNGDGYLLTARLKFRLHSSKVTFTYELERPQNAIESAFKGYVEQIRNARVDLDFDDKGMVIDGSGTPLGYTVLLGKA